MVDAAQAVGWGRAAAGARPAGWGRQPGRRTHTRAGWRPSAHRSHRWTTDRPRRWADGGSRGWAADRPGRHRRRGHPQWPGGAGRPDRPAAELRRRPGVGRRRRGPGTGRQCRRIGFPCGGREEAPRAAPVPSHRPRSRKRGCRPPGRRPGHRPGRGRPGRRRTGRRRSGRRCTGRGRSGHHSGRGRPLEPVPRQLGAGAPLAARRVRVGGSTRRRRSWAIRSRPRPPGAAGRIGRTRGRTGVLGRLIGGGVPGGTGRAAPRRRGRPGGRGGGFPRLTRWLPTW